MDSTINIYLQKMAGEYSGELPEPHSANGKLLKQIAEQGGSGGVFVVNLSSEVDEETGELVYHSDKTAREIYEARHADKTLEFLLSFSDDSVVNYLQLMNVNATKETGYDDEPDFYSITATLVNVNGTNSNIQSSVISIVDEDSSTVVTWADEFVSGTFQVNLTYSYSETSGYTFTADHTAQDIYVASKRNQSCCVANCFDMTWILSNVNNVGGVYHATFATLDDENIYYLKFVGDDITYTTKSLEMGGTKLYVHSLACKDVNDLKTIYFQIITNESTQYNSKALLLNALNTKYNRMRITVNSESTGDDRVIAVSCSSKTTWSVYIATGASIGGSKYLDNISDTVIAI